MIMSARGFHKHLSSYLPVVLRLQYPIYLLEETLFLSKFYQRFILTFIKPI